MTWVKDLATPYHQQDTDYYCGAAVAQMILDSIGSGLLDQNTLYSSNHAHSASGWYTSPDGLNYTLNALMPPPPVFNSFFIVEPGDTVLEGSVNIARTLYIYGVATGTLVYGDGHWVTVRGVKTDVEPATGAYFTIQGFYINNPWPPTPSFYTPALAPPPPHADPDACGSGGSRGIADEYVTYSDWQNTYHTGYDVYGVGHVQFISVCDPRRPPFGTLRLVGQPRLAEGDRIITARRALELAERGIAEHALAEGGALAKALARAQPGEAQLVQRLDRPDDYYYLVTFRRGRSVTALSRIDALHGVFQGAHALADSRRPAMIDREAALKAARAAVFDLDNGAGRIRLREGAFCLYPSLVWRPCRESRSPYYPFYQITVGSSLLYVGYDGQVYSGLHDLGHG